MHIGNSSINKDKTFDINKKIRHLCIKYNFEFIVQQQINTKFSWDDGIHLLDTSL